MKEMLSHSELYSPKLFWILTVCVFSFNRVMWWKTYYHAVSSTQPSCSEDWQFVFTFLIVWCDERDTITQWVVLNQAVLKIDNKFCVFIFNRVMWWKRYYHAVSCSQPSCSEDWQFVFSFLIVWCDERDIITQWVVLTQAALKAETEKTDEAEENQWLHTACWLWSICE